MPVCSIRVAGWLLVMTTGVFAQVPATAVATKAGSAVRPAVTGEIISARVERLPSNKLSLTVAIKPDANLKLHDSTGKEVPTTRLPDGSLKAEIEARPGYVLAPTSTERRALTRDGLHLPARYVSVTPTGTTHLGGLFLRPAVVPLTWSDDARAYTTEIFVGYEFEDGHEDKLPSPKTVAFFAEGANARIREDKVTIDKSGPAGYQRVTLSTGQIDGVTNFTARAGPVDELKSSVAVQREPGALKLSLPSTELPAFGVGSGDVTVTLLARDGMPLNAPNPIEVQLSSRRLRQPPMLVIPPGKSSMTADFRTAGYGADEILAQSGTLRAVLPVRLVFPVAATFAALIGGALGGGTRYLRNKGKRSQLLVRRVIEGMLVGLILVGAAWAGLVSVDLSAGILGTPFGAFVLAALAGYLGCVVLDRVAKKTFGGEKAKV